ncbi:MAG: hypothetical protein JSS63_15230 [Bacteroidetes bacterium]|nr:hypothetical protein [Bacteroidota bacterium]MBX7046206.1 hypothetical protein [Ignavibacteria bacterium]
MKTTYKNFRDFKKQTNLTDKELAESFVFPSKLSKSKQETLHKKISEFRKKRISQMSSEERLKAGLRRLKYSMEEFIRSENNSGKYSFSFFLNEYLSVTKRKENQLSEEINVRDLRPLLQNKRKPSDAIIKRLALHSNNFIPALIWYKISEKQKEFKFIDTDLWKSSEIKNIKKTLNIG